MHKQTIWIASGGLLVGALSLCIAAWSIFGTKPQPPQSYTVAEQAEIDKFCAEYGSDVQAADKNGRTLLHAAVRNNESVAVIRFLVSKGADVYAKDNAGFTPLDLAEKSDDAAIQDYCKSLRKKPKKTRR